MSVNGLMVGLAQQLALGDADVMPAIVSEALRSGALQFAGSPVWYVRRVRDGLWYGPGRFRWVERIEDARVYKTEKMARRGADGQAHDVRGGDMDVVRVVPIQLETERRTSTPSHYGPEAPGWQERMRYFLSEASLELDERERAGQLSRASSRLWALARHLPEDERPTAIQLLDTGQVIYDEAFRERMQRAYDIDGSP